MVMVNGKRKMTMHSPDKKVQVCKEIDARGGDKPAIKMVADKEKLAGSLVTGWFLEFKVYGKDTFHKAKEIRSEKARKRALAMKGVGIDRLAELESRVDALEQRIAAIDGCGSSHNVSGDIDYGYVEL